MQLTGNACAQPTLMATSQPGGAPFFVVPPATADAQVNVTGSAAGATANLHLSTEDVLYDACNIDKVYAVTGWAHSPTLGYAPLLGDYFTLLDAAPPGQVMPASQRVDAFEADLIHGDHAGVSWHPVDNAQFDPQLHNGSLESVRGIGGGSYLTDLRAGPDPGPVHGQIYLNWGNTQVALHGAVNKANAPNVDFNDLTFAWSVDLTAPKVLPSPVPLTPFSATDSPLHVEATALPLEYVAGPVQVDLLQDDEVIRSCAVPYINVGNFFCDFPRGLLVDTSKQYSARMVLNDGTPFRMESPRTPITFGQVIVGGYGIVPHSASNSQNTQSTNHAKGLGGMSAMSWRLCRVATRKNSSWTTVSMCPAVMPAR